MPCKIKIPFAVFAIIWLGLALPGQAQRGGEDQACFGEPLGHYKLVKDNTLALSVNVMPIILGGFGGQLEFRINHFVSVVFPFGIFSPAWSLARMPTQRDIQGWAAAGGGGLRFYVTGYPLDKGLYVQTSLAFGMGSKPTFGTDGKIDRNGRNFIQLAWYYEGYLGYSWVTDVGIILDISAGFNLLDAKTPSEIRGQGLINFNQLRPDVRFLLGYALF